MNQRPICLFLAIKGLPAQAIHNELVAVLGADALAYSTVTNSLGQWQFPSVSYDNSERPPRTVINDAVLGALKKHPFSSIRELAKLTCIPTTTVHRHLTCFRGFLVKHLRWVLSSLRDTQKTQRPIFSNRLRRKLGSIKHQGWQFIITLDESWSDLTTDYKQISLRHDQEPPVKPRHTI
jgi:hypothetical protein